MPRRTGVIDRAKLQDATRLLLEGLGYDKDHPDIVDTPRRVAESWTELCGIRDDPVTPTAFQYEHDQMVVVSGIDAWSVCEHHLLPFSMTIAIGYISRGHLLGLSKLPRLALIASRGLQVQERITDEIAENVARSAKTNDVAVHITGHHLCMAIRGVRQAHSVTTTNVMRGAFSDKERTRAEFLEAVRNGQ